MLLSYCLSSPVQSFFYTSIPDIEAVCPADALPLAPPFAPAFRVAFDFRVGVGFAFAFAFTSRFCAFNSALRRSLRMACAAQTVFYAAAARLSDHRPWSSNPCTHARSCGFHCSVLRCARPFSSR